MHFRGELGAGKTTLIQGILKGLEIHEPVLSPTFSIMETYTTKLGLDLLHIDLYRIEDHHELLLIGLDEYSRSDYAWFIEWPQRGRGIVPDPDLCVTISHAGGSRNISVQGICDLAECLQ